MASVADALAPHVDSGQIPGFVAVVGRDDDIEVTVLGDQAVGGAPMREDSLFRIASAGKPITAAATLALVADGRLALDDAVDDLLPELAEPRATDTVFLNGQSWGYGGGVDIDVCNSWNVVGRYGWVGGTGTSAYIVPSDNSVDILLTQTEFGGPNDSDIVESFWAAAAAQNGHNT